VATLKNGADIWSRRDFACRIILSYQLFMILLGAVFFACEFIVNYYSL